MLNEYSMFYSEVWYKNCFTAAVPNRAPTRQRHSKLKCLGWGESVSTTVDSVGGMGELKGSLTFPGCLVSAVAPLAAAPWPGSLAAYPGAPFAKPPYTHILGAGLSLLWQRYLQGRRRGKGTNLFAPLINHPPNSLFGSVLHCAAPGSCGWAGAAQGSSCCSKDSQQGRCWCPS